MLNKSLEKLVRARIDKILPIVEDDLVKVEEAERAGDRRAYFAMAELGNYPDLYWILEQYEVARHYYQLAAKGFLEKRAWYEEHDPSFATNMDWDLPGYAAILLKAGMLDLGREWLERAYRWELQQKDGPSHYRMRRIGLFAAQVGLKELCKCVHNYVDSQLHMLRWSAEKTRRAAILLHHIEPAEAQFLLGEYEDSKRNLEQVLEGKKFCEEQHVTSLYTPAERNFVFSKAKWLYQTVQMLDGGRDWQPTYREILGGLEKAMMWAWRDGDVTGQCYRLRLYTLMAKDIAEGRKANPNPFADQQP